MMPAYHIPLSPAELRLLGSLSAIQAQSEWAMQVSVKNLLGVSVDSAKLIMGSTSVQATSEIWRAIVLEKHPDKEAHYWCGVGFEILKDFSRWRNSYVHALYGVAFSEPLIDVDGRSLPSDQIFMIESREAKKLKKLSVMGRRGFAKVTTQAKAMRVKSHATNDISNLKTAVRSATHLSIITAFICDTSRPNGPTRETWRRRLSRLPLPQPPKTTRQRAKGQQHPPQS